MKAKFMNNNIKNTLRYGLLAVAGASVMLSCTDTWDDHYDKTSSNGYAGTTFKAIEEKASDFAEIVKAVGYQRELASENIYTIWAPANGSFDKEELMDLAATDPDQVIDRFIKNHMSRYAVSQSNEDKEVVLMNKKKVLMTDAEKNQFGGVDVDQANLVCTNGVLHIIDGQHDYVPNINELIRDQYLASTQEGKKECSFYTFIEENDSDVLDESRSVSRGVDEDGNKIWVDRVTTHTNLVLDAMNAEVYDEDSDFVAIIPSEAAWQERYKLAASLLKFNPHENAILAEEGSTAITDSLQHLYAGQFTMRDLFFNRNANLHPEDSLISTYYYRGDWPNSIYYKKEPLAGLPQDKELNDILGKVGDPIECSNGVAYVVDEFPMTPVEQFFYKRTIRAMKSLIDQTTTNPQFTKSISETINEYAGTYQMELIDEGGEYIRDDDGNIQYAGPKYSYHYVDVAPLNKAVTPNIGFRLRATLSGTYDVYIVLCRPWWRNPAPTDEDYKGYKFNAKIYERGDDGEYSTKIATDLQSNPKDASSKTFVVEAAELKEHPVDTVYLGQISFRNAYYGRADEGVVLQLTPKMSSAEAKKYSREMLISDFILKPNLEATEAALKDDEVTVKRK